MATPDLAVYRLPQFPLVAAGDDIVSLITDGMARAMLAFQTGDILVLAQKIISKAEGRMVRLADITPSERAAELARDADKDPRVVELILSESQEVLRVRPGVIIVTHNLGVVLANAGIDASNVAEGDDAQVLLLPEDPDRSCAEIRDAIKSSAGVDIGVVINDSLGRAWRNGTLGTAIGAAGFAPLADLTGTPDLFGRKLQTTELGVGDEIAAAASLAMGQAGEGCPAVLVRGAPVAMRAGTAKDLIRPTELDLFR